MNKSSELRQSHQIAKGHKNALNRHEAENAEIFFKENMPFSQQIGFQNYGNPETISGFVSFLRVLSDFVVKFFNAIAVSDEYYILQFYLNLTIIKIDCPC